MSSDCRAFIDLSPSFFSREGEEKEEKRQPSEDEIAAQYELAEDEEEIIELERLKRACRYEYFSLGVQRVVKG
jgi:hypothetical protein